MTSQTAPASYSSVKLHRWPCGRLSVAIDPIVATFRKGPTKPDQGPGGHIHTESKPADGQPHARSHERGGAATDETRVGATSVQWSCRPACASPIARSLYYAASRGATRPNGANTHNVHGLGHSRCDDGDVSSGTLEYGRPPYQPSAGRSGGTSLPSPRSGAGGSPGRAPSRA